MFKLLKSIFKDKKTELRQKIIDVSIEESWFRNSFESQEDLHDPEKCKNYREYTYMVGCDVRDAIIKNFLIDKGYLSKLIIKHKQLIYKDEYGDWNHDDWIREVKKFTEKRSYEIYEQLKEKTPQVLVNSLVETEYWHDYIFEDEILTSEMWECVNLIVEFEMFMTDEPDNELEIVEDPYEYERLISERLCELGWDAYSTSGSGDQGADVVAERLGMKFVIQCKLYSQPVGNKAVQEVSSARDFYDAVGAVVVTNNDYTKSVRQLAESQNVWLLQDSQLEEFTGLVDAMIAKVS